MGGPFVEYSGAHWSVFFLAEYINTFAIAVLTVILFFGGWAGPGLSGYWEIIWLLFKVYLVVMVIFWIRGTFPRLRIDQLMAFAWKVVVPMSFLSVVMTAIYQFYGWACLVADPDVFSWAGLRGLRDLPADDRAGKPRGRGEGTAGGAAGPKTERARRSEE